MAPKKKLTETQSLPPALIKEYNEIRTELSELRSELDDLTTQSAQTLGTQLDQTLKRWGRTKVKREEWEGVFVIFTCYPSLLASLIRDGNWRQNQAALCALESLDILHTRACKILATWACRLDLNGGLLEVSGEYCRDVLIANPGDWLGGGDGRWPYCLSNRLPSLLPPDVCQTINNAEVVLRQLQQLLDIVVKDEDAIIAKLFTGEEAALDNEKAPLGFPLPSRTDNVPASDVQPNESFRHSEDFTSVHWCGNDYNFTKTQAACVKVLCEAWENKTPALKEETILEKAGSCGNRLRDVFDKGKHPAWGKMIVTVGKGRFQLQKPKEP